MTQSGSRLRDEAATLAALVQRTSAHLGIDPAFVEKDFWVTEVLRAVASPFTVEDRDGVEQAVLVVFKGGTSLSKVFGIIDRFSEDVDLLVVFPDASVGKRERAFKEIASRVQSHLGLDEASLEVRESTKGVKRNVRYAYPREFSSDQAKEFVLLEMGSRGGDDPHELHEVRSLVAAYAADELGESVDRWEEFAPVTIAVLDPVRTLIEKLALLHTLAARIDENDEDGRAAAALALAGRHYYDIHCLLRTREVVTELAALGTTGVAALAADIHERGKAAGWESRSRPEVGYGVSAAFSADAHCSATAAASYEVALGMVHGPRPTFADCLAAVAAARGLL